MRHANTMSESLFGYFRDELIGRDIEMLIPARFADRHLDYRAAFAANPHVRAMGRSHMELFACRKDGGEFPVDVMLSPLQTGSAMLTLCAVRDASERKSTIDRLRLRNIELERLQVQLEELARNDSLTGLLNRRTFQEQAEWIIRNGLRREECTSMLMIDIDHFKHINDQFGHSEGDRALFIVAATLKATCRQNDVAGRYGGEEFSVALPDTDVAGSRVAAENFRAAIAAIGELRFSLRASIGIVTFVPEQNMPQLAMPELYAALIRNADAALYAAKNGGRNQVRHFDDLRRETLVARDIARFP